MVEILEVSAHGLNKIDEAVQSRVKDLEHVVLEAFVKQLILIKFSLDSQLEQSHHERILFVHIEVIVEELINDLVEICHAGLHLLNALITADDFKDLISASILIRE